eukprot:1462431-Pyramimonas_sp.AAC.1
MATDEAVGGRFARDLLAITFPTHISAHPFGTPRRVPCGTPRGSHVVAPLKRSWPWPDRGPAGPIGRQQDPIMRINECSRV